MYYVDALAGTGKTYQAHDRAHWMARGGQKSAPTIEECEPQHSSFMS
jgi:hypothetical protein